MVVVSPHSKMISTTILISCEHFYEGNCQLTYSLQQLHVVHMGTCLMMAETLLSSITSVHEIQNTFLGQEEESNT